jgi:hypothetical protein
MCVCVCVCVCVTHEINVRWLPNQIMPIAIILMICGARIKSLVHCQNIMSYSFWMIIEDYWNLRQSTNQKHNNLISFKHMYFFFLCLFLNLHTTIHHSNIGAHFEMSNRSRPSYLNKDRGRSYKNLQADYNMFAIDFDVPCVRGKNRTQALWPLSTRFLVYNYCFGDPKWKVGPCSVHVFLCWHELVVCKVTFVPASKLSNHLITPMSSTSKQQLFGLSPSLSL